MNTETIIRLAGAASLCILAAGALMPTAINLKSEVKRMAAFHQKLFWVYLSYTAFTILWIGLVSLIFARELSTGTLLAKILLSYFALFWGGRLAIQYGFFDTGAFQKKAWHRIGYHTLTSVFLAVTAAYCWAIFKT